MVLSSSFAPRPERALLAADDAPLVVNAWLDLAASGFTPQEAAGMVWDLCERDEQLLVLALAMRTRGKLTGAVRAAALDTLAKPEVAASLDGLDDLRALLEGPGQRRCVHVEDLPASLGGDWLIDTWLASTPDAHDNDLASVLARIGDSFMDIDPEDDPQPLVQVVMPIPPAATHAPAGWRRSIEQALLAALSDTRAEIPSGGTGGGFSDFDVESDDPKATFRAVVVALALSDRVPAGTTVTLTDHATPDGGSVLWEKRSLLDRLLAEAEAAGRRP